MNRSLIFCLFFAFLIMVAVPLFSALPPFVQRAREIETIVSDPALYQMLGSAEAIEQIVKVEGGYLILTRNFLVRAEVEYFSTRRPGPASYQIHFKEPVPLREYFH